nr:protein NRT1/ PTR FAMILY 4.6-like [Tanacetum cinerariifolium]
MLPSFANSVTVGFNSKYRIRLFQQILCGFLDIRSRETELLNDILINDSRESSGKLSICSVSEKQTGTYLRVSQERTSSCTFPPIQLALDVNFLVLVAAIFNTFSSNARNAAVSTNPPTTSNTSESNEEDSKAKEEYITEDLCFLDRAFMNKSSFTKFEVTIKQMEEVKIVLKNFPVFMSTIMLNCCLAQLSTFSVQQTDIMNTKIGSLRVPPDSLPVFPVIFIMNANPSSTLGPLSQDSSVTTHAKFMARINNLLEMRQTIDSLLFKTINESTNQSFDSEIFCPEERIKELELRTQQRNNFEEELFKDKFPNEEELAYHKELLREPQPSFSTLEPNIRRGDPWNLKIPCVIGTIYTGHAYIDL